jgi:SPP1 family predicted phage head-tail adaptor
MTTPRIGSLRRRLTIEAPSRTGDEAGAATVAWVSVAEVWAAVVPARGRAAFDGDAIVARVTHEIVMRWRGDVTGAMRLRDGARVFLIQAVRDPDDRRRRLSCLAEEQAP